LLIIHFKKPNWQANLYVGFLSFFYPKKRSVVLFKMEVACTSTSFFGMIYGFGTYLVAPQQSRTPSSHNQYKYNILPFSMQFSYNFCFSAYCTVNELLVAFDNPNLNAFSQYYIDV
jgi:hypothetical protein